MADVYLEETRMLVWYALLALTLGLAVIISSVILPRMYLKSRYKLIKSEDRGIKKIMEKNGQTLVLEPAVKWRKYIKQNQRRNRISFLRYSVV